MAVPDYQTIMLPLLKFTSDGAEHSIDEAVGHMVELFQLTPEEQKERIPSGQSTYIRNRVGWARTYLKKAGLLSSPKRGYVAITDRGRELLSRNPERIDQQTLKQFPEFVEFVSSSKERADDEQLSNVTNELRTPEEELEVNYQALRAQLADEILDQVKSCSPQFFEQMVVELLVGMGYGGSLKDAGQATKQSNDGGVDGIIKEDRLGLDTIYIQAKRWENSIQRPEIQKFAGALQGVRARKGVFITTSKFSDGAKEYASTIENKIVLIDGEQLAQYMIDFGIGVSKHHVYEVKKLDGDYFEEDPL